jgi:hypothetical protein
MTTFTVTNLNDSGVGSLRAAITAANADSGTPAVINFTVNGTVTLASALPSITNAVTIDATTAPTYVAGGPPVVAIDFSQNSGLVFDVGSDNSRLLGVAIDNANGNGVTLNASAITLDGDYIGLDLSGAAAGNSGDGVYVSATSSNNQIGVNPTSSLGTAAAGGVIANVISGNGGNGISFHGSSGNTVIDTRIGTDPTGFTAIANGANGIWITGGSSNNTIGGIAYVDSATGKGNDPTGTEGTVNPTFVTPPLGNLISGNGQTGVLIDTGSQNNQLSGNFIGTTADGSATLGNGGDGVWINGADGNSLIGTSLLNPPGSADPGSINRTPFNYYNVISGNGGNGLEVTNSNNVTVQANFFGTGANNASLVPNKFDGILVDGSSQNTTVGGVIPLGNVASGNGLNGIEVSGTASGFTTFNTFGGGLAFGTAAPNGNDGLLITSDDSSGAGPNTIQTNVFSGNTNNGIELAGNAAGNVIDPNIVGLTTAGDAPLPNGGDGLLITGTAHDNTVGGNVVSVIPNQTFSENDGYGIAIVGNAYDNTITPFNMVGTGVSGLGPPVNPALPNGAGGILIGGNAHDNTVGGTEATANASGNTENVIAGNTGAGITILGSATNNIVDNNKIGVDQLGVPLRNSGDSILRYFGTGSFSGVAALVAQSMTPTGGTSVPETGGELVLSQDIGGYLTQTAVAGGQMSAEWTAFGVGDFNGDGTSDVAWTNGTGGQVTIWELTGASVSASGLLAGQMSAEWQVAAIGDFNGDGDADILWHAGGSGSDAGQVEIWTVSGTQLTASGVLNATIGAEWSPVATGDFYGTGRSAVLWEDSTTGVLQDWSVNGLDPVSVTQNVGQVGSAWRVAGVGHFNGIGSGDPTGDIVWVDTSNDVQIWQMTNGQVAQIVRPNATLGTGWTLQGVGDYTGSGSSELLWTNSNGDNVIWQVNGTAVTQLTVNPVTQPVPAELSGNGLTDTLMVGNDTGALVLDEVGAGPAMGYTQIGGLGSEWQLEGTGSFLGDGKDGFLMWAGTSSLPDYGSIVVGEDVGGTAQYTAIGGVGPEWQFEGNGPLLGGSADDFLLWDGSSASSSYGALVVGSVVGGTAQFTQIGGVGPEWQFKGVGDYLGDGKAGFLMEDQDTGSLAVGEDVSGSAQYTTVGGLGPEWQFEGSGNLLGQGQDDFLIWGGSSAGPNLGALVVGQVDAGTAQYTQIGTLGSEWQFLGVGNYDGASSSEFLMRNSNSGTLVIGTVAATNGTYGVTYTQVGGVGSEWNFHTDNVAVVA